MEAFEHVVNVYLQTQGYAVTTNVKFPVRQRTRRRDRAEYQTHGYEVDIVGARGGELLLGEAKSYFGSRGLVRDHFVGLGGSSETARALQRRMRIFNDSEIRDQVLEQAKETYGYPISKIRLGLFVGKFGGGHEEDIRRHLEGLRVGGGPVRIVGIQDISRQLISAIESSTYVDDPVIVTLRLMKAAGYLQGA